MLKSMELHKALFVWYKTVFVVMAHSAGVCVRDILTFLGCVSVKYVTLPFHVEQ